jgi:glycerol-1-phosphate dehydrogenase [NAD(P)+]
VRTVPRLVIPSVVRVKPGALDRVGIYLERERVASVVVAHSEGLVPSLRERLAAGCGDRGVAIVRDVEVADASSEGATELRAELGDRFDAIVGLGGGKALDYAKYLAHLADRPYFAVPTSLSNDGFSSPQASLTVAGRRRSLATSMPYAVVVDTEVCLAAPEPLWWSGVGDLVAKLTATVDWKIAFHESGTPIDDFALLLSDATVYQFMARPVRDLEGMRVLATALMLNGIAMGICGSSRPASGSEHLISHALDEITARPRLHGLQVGTAAYLVSLLQERNTRNIDRVLTDTGFWAGIESDPFSRAEWREAVRRAPAMKSDFHTVLSRAGSIDRAIELLESDGRLARCIIDLEQA